MKVRNQELCALFTPEEVEQLKQRMAEAGVRNRSAFIRKMALDGYIIKLDKIAKKANSSGTIYGADIADLQVKQDEIWELAREIAARLSTIQ